MNVLVNLSPATTQLNSLQLNSMSATSYFNSASYINFVTKSTEASALANAKQDLAKADLTKAGSYWGLQLGIRAMVDLI